MKNRLPFPSRAFIVFLCAFFTLLSAQLFAQTSAFNFNYPGPNTVAVGPNCNASVSGNIGVPIVTSTLGATITQSQFDEPATGFAFTDLWPAGITVVVWWRVSDNLGNSALFSFPITFADLTPPVFDLTGIPSLVQVNSIVQAPPIPVVPVADNCTPANNLVQTFVETAQPALCQGGTFTRTWTATDAEGLTSTFTQTIIVYKDTLPPQILFSPQNGASACDVLPTAYPAWLATQMALFSASDASGTPTYTNNSPLPYPMGCAQNQVVTFKATDNCGLSTSKTAVFSTSDSQSPTVSQPPADIVLYCQPGNAHLDSIGAWISQHAHMIAQDACTPDEDLVYSMIVNGAVCDSAVVIDSLLASYADGCGFKLVGSQTLPDVLGTIRVDFFVADDCGNSTFAGQASIGLIDTLAPAISGPVNFEQCGGNDNLALQNWIDNHGNASVDECGTYTWTNFSWTDSDGQSGNGTFGAGPYPQVRPHDCDWYVDVTFRSTDGCGNTGSGILRFQMRDTIAPSITGFAATDTVYCPQDLPSALLANITDNCDTSMTLSRSVHYQDTVCVGNYKAILTWTAADDCGNTSSIQQTIYVRDTTKPVFILVPQNTTVSCDAFAAPGPAIQGLDIDATDLCGQLDTILTQSFSTQHPDPDFCSHYTYTYSRIFTAIDGCGNFATTVQIISVEDNDGPVFSGFLDTTAVCETQPVMPSPTASDVCGGAVTLPVLSNTIITAGACADSYTLTRVWISTDICDNVGTFSQNIHVLDTLRPNLSGIPADVVANCENIPPVPALSTITGSDNCDDVVDITFQETEIRDPNPANCAHWNNYIIRREWTATDNCGNARTYTQNIQVQDNTGPVLSVPATVQMPSKPGECGADVIVPTPLSFYDACSSLESAIELRDTTPLTGPPVDSIPVDTVVFQWASPNLPPNVPVIGDALLTIYLDNADAEDSTETFTILGEYDTVLGRTKRTPMQCGSSDTTITVPADLLNAWLTDGELVIRLVPDGVGPFAVNPICTGRRARAKLNYTTAQQQVPVSLFYSIDNGAYIAYPPAGAVFLETGQHIINYRATDCAGNSSTATLSLEIADIEPPMMSTPAALTAYVGAAGCNATANLPFPTLSDNCGFSGQFSQSSALTPLSFVFNPNAQFVPAVTTLNIGGLIPNAVTAGTLKIRHKGDNANVGEFFNVSDENNQPWGSTLTGTILQECQQYVEKTWTVPAATINNWAMNTGAPGSASFRLVPNTDAVNFSDFIGPCGPLNNVTHQDGISMVQATLEYSYAVVQYVIKDAGNVTVQTGQLSGSQTPVTLGRGNYTVQYSVLDNSGISATVSFPLTVLDTIRPVAQCSPTIIFTNPSGVVNYTLQPQEVNNNSVDNCSGANLTLQVTPNNFTCNMAGTNTPVTLTVTDQSGNSSSCQTIVAVGTQSVLATSTTGACEGDTIHFTATPPAAPGNVVYTYMWTNPAGSVFSAAQNPSLPNATQANEGIYTVKVTGLTGCTATGTTQLDLNGLPTVPVLMTPTLVCQGDNITLSTNPYNNGINVSYKWYSGIPPNGTLLNTTMSPNFFVGQLPPGVHSFYVRIQADGCSSAPSAVINVTVQASPSNGIETNVVSVCEGQPLSLGTTVSGPNVTYQWSGPNFSNQQQYPLVTLNAVPAQHSGTYTLIVYENGCPSAPGAVTVTVKNKPPQPQLSGATSVCEGASVKLVCNITGAQQFVWTGPGGFDTITFNINELVLPDVMLADSGAWTVQVVQLGCPSDPSPQQLVQVQAYPQVVASANTPICLGQPLQLNAGSNNPNLSCAWTGPDGFEKFECNPQDPTPASGAYIVTMSTTFGCSGKDTVDVFVVPPPEAYATNMAPVCADGTQSAFLQSTVVSPNGPFTYLWTGPGTFSSVLANPEIPTVTAANNGTYTLVVTDAFGCASAPVSTILNVQNPLSAPVLSTTTPSICEGQSISLSINNPNQYPPNATYEWTTPVGVIVTGPNLTINNATLQNAGDYAVKVNTPTCNSPSSVVINIVVNPIPAPPVISYNAPVCEGQTLSLSTTVIPGAQYFWTGPPPFTSNQPNPVISPADTLDSGTYTLAIQVLGCLSPLSNALEVEVKPRPAQPMAIAPQAVCLSEDGAVLTLIVEPNSATNGAQYTWYNSLNVALGPAGFPLQFELSDLSGISAGNNSFYVSASLDGCLSAPSPAVTVQFDTIPANTAFAGNDFISCIGQPLVLNAAAPPAGISGLWKLVSGTLVTIINPGSDSTLVTGALAGNTYKFVWQLSNGACKNFSTDTVSVKVVQPETAVATAFYDTCYATSIQLSAQQGVNSTGMWSQNSQQLGAVIVNPLDPNTLVTGLLPNTYFFYWTLTTPGCQPSVAEVRVSNYGSVAFAGEDKVLCSTEPCTELNATELPFGETGQWLSDDPDIIFASPSLPNTSVCGLKPGQDNVLYWITNDGFCGLKSYDTVVVQYELTPTAIDDAVEVSFSAIATFNILDNDILPDEYRILIEDFPLNGSLDTTNIRDGIFSYQPDLDFVGSDVMEYRICNKFCNKCDIGKVVFTVSEADGCDIPTIITPNDDNVNDVFFIPCIGQYPDNEVSIFNQWGDIVFNEKKYSNSWDGTYKGEKLPSGTYFYAVILEPGQKPLTGFIIVQR